MDSKVKSVNGADKVCIIDRKDDGNALIPCLPLPKTKIRPIDERRVKKANCKASEEE